MIDLKFLIRDVVADDGAVERHHVVVIFVGVFHRDAWLNLRLLVLRRVRTWILVLHRGGRSSPRGCPRTGFQERCRRRDRLARDRRYTRMVGKGIFAYGLKGNR